MAGGQEELYGSLKQLFERPGEVYALFQGSDKYPDIKGRADFYPLWGGTVAAITVSGLPSADGSRCQQTFHGLHIHEGASCGAVPGDNAYFPLSGNHYNPHDCPHPQHAGDLPPLLANDGFAFLVFYTGRFTPEEIVGHTIIIHSDRDDFTSQPSGSSGTKIACGEIKSPYSS